MARKERKVVTVLFADLVGFTARAEELDPEDVEAILRPYHERLRGELQRFGGTVEKFIGDAVMAVFGAPVAHEDDPERAVRAALAIRDQIVEDGTLAVRIAVTTGEALVGVDARPEAGEGMVAGDVVNTAARLQSAAPTNSILVGETTYRATQDTIEYREHEAVEAKGKAEPIPVWEVVNPRARVAVELRAPATPLVGRGRERELLLGTFERVRADRSTQLFTIVGVPGIGKSRLVAELYGEIERDPELTHWRQGRSLPYGEGGAFWAFAEMAKAEAGILDGDSAADAERKLHEALAALVPPEDADWLESRLRPLVGLEAPPGTRDESFAAWRRFAEALAERHPTVLVFEDLHWADDDLLDFVDELVDWVEDVPMLVLGTARPELLDRRPNWGGGKRNAQTLSLPPLGDDETARLLGSLLNRSVLPAETQQALLARAGGNPFYAEQFARMFAERGEAAGELPETVQGIIAARLDSLPGEEKRVLLDAAVLGKTFWVGALGTDDAEGLLHALQRKEFVRRERRSSVVGEQEFTFTHLLVRDVAYGQLPRAERAERHVRAARWIESVSAERSEDRAELLAHHYGAALELARAAGGPLDELAERALDALLEAAEHAQKLAAFSRTEQYARAALELTLPDDPRRARALLARAAAEGELGKPECVQHALEAATLFAALGDLELAARAETDAANWLWNYGRPSEAHSAVERALARVRDEPSSEAKAAALVTHARLLMLAGRQHEAVEVGRAGLEIAERLGSEERQAGVLITIGTARNSLGEDGTLELERGIDIAGRLHGEREFTRGYNNLAEHKFALGELDEAGRLYEIVRERVERLGMIQGNAWITAQASTLAYVAGDWERAGSLAQRFHELAGPMSGHYLDHQVHETQAQMAMARADPAAEELWRLAVEEARGLKDPQALGPVLASRARVLLAKGTPEEATALVDEVLALRDDEGNAIYFTWLIDLGWLLHDLGRPGELPSDRSGSVWHQAGRLIASGSFLEAAELLGSKGLRTEEAHARLRAAAQQTGTDRAAQLAQALAFYRSVGATRFIREAENLLAATA
jgi:class 3 adenylate cyclase/tetratricopeptide (TPR) repeat protein